MRLKISMLVAALSGALVVVAAGAWAQGGSPGSGPDGRRNFDYWQPEWMMRELWGPGRMSKSMQVRMLRHSTYLNYGLPKAYAGARSPLQPESADINAGNDLFQKNCASCHGKDGMGGGAAGNSLAPSPALLAFMISRPISVDEYLLWAIADGGEQFSSGMPAFKGKLTDKEIWQVIAYMRAGFKSASEPAAGRK